MYGLLPGKSYTVFWKFGGTMVGTASDINLTSQNGSAEMIKMNNNTKLFTE